jgi:hypothetical protein
MLTSFQGLRVLGKAACPGCEGVVDASAGAHGNKTLCETSKKKNTFA